MKINNLNFGSRFDPLSLVFLDKNNAPHVLVKS